MALPVSAVFDIVDWNYRSSSTTDTGDATINDSASGALQQSIVNSGSARVENAVYQAFGLEIRSLAGTTPRLAPVLGTYLYPLTIPNTFTLEFDLVIHGDLPVDFSDKENRIFVGAVNRSGSTAGFLFSRLGIAVAATPYDEDDDITILQGSNRFTISGEQGWRRDTSGDLVPVTIRAIVRQDTGVTEIYITDRSVAYTEASSLYGAHQQKYSIPSVSSKLNSDMLLLATRANYKQGPDSSNYSLRLSSLRVATGAVNTPNKPVAVASQVTRATLGRRTKIDGRASYDPEGTELSWEWDIVERPSASVSLLSGGSYAEATIGTSTVDNQVTFRHKNQSTLVNDYRVVLINKTTTAPLKVVSVKERFSIIQLETGSLGNIKTTASKLVSAFTNTSSGFYNSELAKLLSFHLPEGTLGTGVLVAGEVALTGGVGSSDSSTSFSPDIEGLYRISLRVNNGSLYSDYQVLTLLATPNDQLLNHRPNTDYIWRGLSDAWSMVPDKQQFEVMWSAASQVVSDQLLRCWQNELSKSIKTIPRRYQRRWLNLAMKLELSPTLNTKVIMFGGERRYYKPDTFDHLALTSEELFGTLVKQCLAVDPDTLVGDSTSHKFAVGPVIVINESGAIVRSAINEIKLDEAVIVPSTRINLATKAITGLRVIDSGNFARYIDDPDGTGRVLVQTVGEVLASNDIQAGDYLLIETDTGYASYAVADPLPEDGSGAESILIENCIEVSSAPVDINGVERKWRVVRNTGAFQLAQYPYYDLGSNIDLTTAQLTFGDAALVKIYSPVSDAVLEVQVPILVVTRREVFVDWDVFVAELNTLALAMGKPANYTVSKVATHIAESNLIGFYRTQRIPTVEGVTSIPTLGTNSIVAEFAQNTHYTVNDGFVALTPLNTLSVDTNKGSAVVTVTGGGSLENTDISSVIFTEGPIGYYSVLRVSRDGKNILLGSKVPMTGTFSIETPRYSATGSIPEDLWSEITYFDNNQAISNNFGVLVGFKKEDYEKCIKYGDYKSIVQSMWVALLSGPKVNALELAANSLLNLPYAEREGVVTVHSPTDTNELGRLVIKTPNEGGYTTYYYPRGYELAINPRTGRKIKAVSLANYNAWYLTSEQQTALAASINDTSLPEVIIEEVETPNGIERLQVRVKDAQRAKLKRAQDADDAFVDAYVSLLEASQVYDYVSEPEKVDGILRSAGTSILERPHTFILELPVDKLTDQDWLPCLTSFIGEWKPARTNVLLLSTKNIKEVIDVSDELYASVTLSIADTPASFLGVKSSTASTAESQVPYTYPSDRTEAKGWAYSDVFEKYESGHSQGFVDDYSGDGSWNTARAALDMVNTTDSDVDVLRTRMWVPIQKVVDGTQFQVGEKIKLWDYSTPPGSELLGYGWDTDTSLGHKEGAPPVILHIGSGEHPLLPFGIQNPQDDHPYTYLLIGFYSADGSINYANETRLRALSRRTGAQTWIKGYDSDAVAEVLPIRGGASYEFPSYDIAADPTHVDHANHKFYFSLVWIFQADKHLKYGPEQRSNFTITQYIPTAGEFISNLDTSLSPAQNDRQLQVYPYDSTIADDEQFVPSFSPGFFSNWFIGAGTNDVVWGWRDEGFLSSINPHSVFVKPTTSTTLRNVHIGKILDSDKDLHYTHGFVKFAIPDAIIAAVSMGVTAGHIRLHGYYFINDDTTKTAIPDETPSSFDGTIGGSWVFLRNEDTLVEYACPSIIFETGTAASTGVRTVLNIDGFFQTSTGHIIEGQIPVVPDGTYDVILRQYRPYRINPTDPISVKMTEYVAAGVYTQTPVTTSFGGSSFGEGSLGA